jgi:hypothetical protein
MLLFQDLKLLINIGKSHKLIEYFKILHEFTKKTRNPEDKAKY